MKTEDAIKVLLSGLYEPDQASRPSSDELRLASEHVVATRDAWVAFAAVYERIKGEAPPNRKLMEALFGCAQAEAELEQFAGLDPREMEAANPRLAMHLSLCPECSEVFASAAGFATEMSAEFSLINVQFATAGATNPETAPGKGPAWQRFEESFQGFERSVFRLAESIRCGVTEKLPQFLAFPAGMTPAVAGATRGMSGTNQAAPGEAPVDEPIEQLSFRLPEVGVEAKVKVSTGPTAESVTFQIEFSAALPGLCSAELRDAASNECVEADTTDGTSPVVFAGVPCAEYRLQFEFLESRTIAICCLDCRK